MPTTDNARNGARAFTRDMAGPTVLADLRTRLTESVAKIRRAESDEFPPDYRRRIRKETLSEVDRLVAEGRDSYRHWVAGQVIDAQRRYDASISAVGTPAEEARRNTDELRIARLIDSARASGSVAGYAARYANEAMRLYENTNRYGEAIVYARAAIELGASSGNAPQALAGSQAQIDLDYPERVKALADKAAMGNALVTFDRDVEAAIAETYYAAASGAQSMGDDHLHLTREAARAGRNAKQLAFALTERDLEGNVVPGSYVEPAGVNPPEYVKSVLGGSYNESGS